MFISRSTTIDGSGYHKMKIGREFHVKTVPYFGQDEISLSIAQRVALTIQVPTGDISNSTAG